MKAPAIFMLPCLLCLGACREKPVPTEPRLPVAERTAPAVRLPPDPEIAGSTEADTYYHGYLWTRKAGLVGADDRREAERCFNEALLCFRQLRDSSPRWKPEMVAARILRTEEAVAALGPAR